MRSLLHQTTLAITAVLVLISCATQTQAVGTAVTGNPDPNLYARSFFTKQVAANEGLLNLQWISGDRTSSAAQLTYNGEPAYMTCIVGYSDNGAFRALVSVQDTLKGANEEYRNYVKDPVKPIAVPAGPSQTAGNCFVYRNVAGMYLEQFIQPKSYADRLVTLNQVMPQILKGSIYLYNAGIKQIDLNLSKARILQLPTGQLKATIFAFDVTGRPQLPTNPLDINTTPITKSLGSTGPYGCSGYHEELLHIISRDVDPRIGVNPQNVTPEDRVKIARYIQQKPGPAMPQDSTGKKLEEATAAYISLLQVYATLKPTRDCATLVAALKSMSAPAPAPPKPSGNKFTQFFRKPS